MLYFVFHYLHVSIDGLITFVGEEKAGFFFLSIT